MIKGLAKWKGARASPPASVSRDGQMSDKPKQQPPVASTRSWPENGSSISSPKAASGETSFATKSSSWPLLQLALSAMYRVRREPAVG